MSRVALTEAGEHTLLTGGARDALGERARWEGGGTGAEGMPPIVFLAGYKYQGGGSGVQKRSGDQSEGEGEDRTPGGRSLVRDAAVNTCGMVGSRQILLHVLLLLASTKWSNARETTQADTESSELSPRADTVLTSAVEETGGEQPARLRLHSPFAGPHAPGTRWKRETSNSLTRLSRHSPKFKALKPRQRTMPGTRRRRVSFPMDRIGRSYLPKINTDKTRSSSKAGFS